MLQLKNIVKTYAVGNDEESVHALRGVDLAFRDSEFVAVLGPSGCGKTTLLNILGGLDRYTEGDLIINGRSTKEYADADWDTYRNHSIGFVFQSYNLIPHQSVLANVELALTLSGVSRAERRRRAIEALEKVGLGDQIHKKPNQMSGGQMQRVAIARALVNDPDILLADEPTGALDTVTSVQIMDILKEISQDKLILMVTHNPDLAETYANRIVRLVDGQVMGDTNPYTEEQLQKDYEARAVEIERNISARSKAEAEELIGRARSGEENIERNTFLEAKGELIDRTFERAKREILEMPETEYLEYLTSLLAATFTAQIADEKHNRELYGEDGDETVECYEVLLNARDKERIGAKLVEGAKAKLKDDDAKASAHKLVMADGEVDIDGGLVLRCGSMEINNSVKAIFGELRPRIEAEVSRVLFPDTNDRKKG